MPMSSPKMTRMFGFVAFFLCHLAFSFHVMIWLQIGAFAFFQRVLPCDSPYCSLIFIFAFSLFRSSPHGSNAKIFFHSVFMFATVQPRLTASSHALSSRPTKDLRS